MKKKGSRPSIDLLKPDPPPFEGYEHPYLERFRLPYKSRADQLLKFHIYDGDNSDDC
jgi:hypothetical protein